jgi:hypothetical protein
LFNLVPDMLPVIGRGHECLFDFGRAGSAQV